MFRRGLWLWASFAFALRIEGATERQNAVWVTGFDQLLTRIGGEIYGKPDTRSGTDRIASCLPKSKHGLHPLQYTHKSLERIGIKIRMYLDPESARQQYRQPATRFALRRRFPGRQRHPLPTGRPKRRAYDFSSNAAVSDGDPAC